ncbi:ATP-dependent DNA helicase RecG [Zymomonas mobilis]|uniref:Helicase domain protein n=1 Tax=Zymomonas mobilis subsp. mobilis (strain ATCC 10988 / DSM 424 / LMG 404 / NCIMB 8938 / NRRL B-806 / ZM1) TaxID=555217 RepID=A0A0H3G3F6_ZYMMA|nr:ATP-dependent DNA helicase RecG [Zymomonas mobilis]AEH63313.1 helicase domain protein [Zymomonas mobilis subsp. mobilis ATCC 10988]TQL27072.1 ATP-dependent DNA helicase RecG [Zymomonas mobilis]TQL28501.1 ATP-dependent DNA helicase RecG [Zymomonas mobilis]
MRPDILNPLFAETESLKGVGSALLKPLKKRQLTRLKDLLFYLPSGQMRRVKSDQVNAKDVGATVILTLTAKEYRHPSGRGPFRILAEDPFGGQIQLLWFGNHSSWARKLMPIGETRLVSGKLDIYQEQLQIVHPSEIVPLSEENSIPLEETLYPLSDGLTHRRIGQLIRQAWEKSPDLPEWIEPSLLKKHQWPSWREAVERIHQHPDDRAAKLRIGYDEIFANQLALKLIRAANRRKRGFPLKGDGHLRDALNLPFQPTGAQRRSLAEIEGDMQQASPMLRLLQGDVGSGKTWVALHSLLIAAEAGYQGALLAPTEILARQHFETLSQQLAGLPVNIALLTGRDKGKLRESTLMGLADGSIHLLVGTHAIFQEKVSYKNLGLAIIDEQHRFGVAQRMMLAEKAIHTPHLLVMTATPIPRSLMLTAHGEMDVSRLDEMPPGRQPVETRVISSRKIPEIIASLGRHIAEGGQSYWVCPAVGEADIEEAFSPNAIAAAEQRFSLLQQHFGKKVGLVHGKMKPAEKDKVMDDFAAGKIAILVATTVIEVGVNVPNATLMIIDQAERFGLAQLHQLRGRVGRGGGRSICLLLRSEELTSVARERLALIRECNDGFRLAEEDLRLRGSGEILGTKQSGESHFQIASPEDLSELLPIANDDARLLVDRDGGLSGERGQAARIALYLFERDAGVSFLRSG